MAKTRTRNTQLNSKRIKKRQIHQYSEESLKNALVAIRNEDLSVREASRKFAIPRATLQDRLHGRIAEGPRKMGPPTVLSTEEEQQLVRWLIELAKCGFPQKKEELLNAVHNILVKQNRTAPHFANNKPGDKWYRNFMKRHPELSFREPENLTKARAVMTKEYIQQWFRELEEYLHNMEAASILDDPSRIFDGDETSFVICPKTGKVLAPRGWKNLYDIKKGSEKETVTVLLVFSANGKTLNPMVVFPYTRLPTAVAASVPSEWYIGKSDSGWMRGDVFYEYVANGVDKWLDENNVTRPVLILIDGHKSHLTYELSQFCESRQIILYALPPNTTHILQPADVSVFRPLKTEWKNTVRAWQAKEENSNSVLTKSTFCPLLQEVFSNANLEAAIINGFRKCGIYPFDPSAVDYSKCVQNHLEDLTRNQTTSQEQPDVSLCHLKITENVLKTLQPEFDKKNIVVTDILSVLQQMIRNKNSKNPDATYVVLENGELELAMIDDANQFQNNNDGNDDVTSKTTETMYIVKENGGLELAMIDNANQFKNSNDGNDDVNSGNAETTYIIKENGEVELAMTDDANQLQNNEFLMGSEEENRSTRDDESTEHAYSTDMQNEDRLQEEENGTDASKGEDERVENVEICEDTQYEKQLDEHNSHEQEQNLPSFDLVQKDVDMDEISVIRQSNNLSIMTPLEETSQKIPAKINILQNIQLVKPSTGFEAHLFWPSPLSKSGAEEKRKKEKQPAAISSEAFRLYMKKKSDQKESLEREKLKRKEARLQRAAEKKRQIADRKERTKRLKSTKTRRNKAKVETAVSKLKCPQCEEEVNSDVEDEGLRNVGCDVCDNWYHLRCTEFKDIPYDQLVEKEFICPKCS